MTPSELIAERRAELARRLAALTPEMRAQLAQSRAQLDRASQRGGIPLRPAGAPGPGSYSTSGISTLEK